MSNFEIWDILRVPISYIIKGAYFLIPNYAIALLLFAIVIKAILFPLGIKQQKNMVKQAALKPKENAIRKKYAGRTDKATQTKMQQEVMDLYQRENFNPAGGCLPLLLQFPILLSLYHVIIDPLKYLCNLSAEVITQIGDKLNQLYAAVQAGAGTTVGTLSESILTRLGKGQTLTGIEQVNAIRYFGTENFEGIFDTSKLPDFSLFGLDLSPTPSLTTFNILWLIPVLTFVVMFLSMRLTRKLTYQPQATADAGLSMKMMDYTMPLLSVWIAFTVPAVVGLYWIYQNILGTVQQFILKKMYPIPTFTEEEMKAAEKEMAGKTKKIKQANPSGEKVRSLHHIDDEEYSENDGAAEPKKQKQSILSGMIAPGELQEDDRKDQNQAEEPEDDGSHEVLLNGEKINKKKKK